MSWTKRWRKKKDNHYGERKKDGRDREVFSKKRSMKRERVSEWVRPTAVTGPRGKKYCCLIPNWLSLNWSHGFQENKNEREREREREREMSRPKTCWCSLLEKTLFEYCQTTSTSSSSCTSGRSLFPPTVGWMISDLEWKYGLIWNCNHLYRTSVHEAGGPDGWIIYSIFGLLEKSKFARKH